MVSNEWVSLLLHCKTTGEQWLSQETHVFEEKIIVRVKILIARPPLTNMVAVWLQTYIAVVSEDVMKH
jgi:hypothetical protein